LNKQSLRILLANDHAIVRSGVRRLLEEQSQVAEVGEACDGDEAFRLARAKPWNVLVLDIGMPGRDAMNVVHLLKSEQPELAILILSMYRKTNTPCAHSRPDRCGKRCALAGE